MPEQVAHENIVCLEYKLAELQDVIVKLWNNTILFYVFCVEEFLFWHKNSFGLYLFVGLFDTFRITVLEFVICDWSINFFLRT